jgi:hypothetical protein
VKFYRYGVGEWGKEKSPGRASILLSFFT